MKITQVFTFEAAHQLPLVPDGHKCKNMHGHSYRVEITFEGDLKENGFVADFFDIEKMVGPIIKKLDHHTLNDIEGLENPTAENIVLWISMRVPSSHVRVYETPMCWAEN